MFLSKSLVLLLLLTADTTIKSDECILPRISVSGNIRSRFGDKRGNRTHAGVDIMLPQGTHILAHAAGVVTFSGRQTGYGNLVIIYHGCGYSTLYAHNLSNNKKTGDRVVAGDIIAFVGRTGNATTPHIHLEIIKDGRKIDPYPFLFLSE